jgi:hypothetical protein
MNFKELALNLDAQEKPVEAAWAYEIAISEPNTESEFFLNLAVLYFECRDFGYSAYHHLSNDFVSGAWQRAFEILEIAEMRFGSQTEILFWREYFSFIYAENKQFDNICQELIHRGDSLIPYLYKNNNSEKREYKENVQKLLELVEDGTTERKRYIKSVINHILT